MSESTTAVVHDTTSLMMVEDTQGCELWELSKAESSHFQMEKNAPYRVSEVKPGWLQLGLLRSCCGEFRCQKTGGDVFLAYLDGKEAPKALAQPTIHDFGNGSYALLLPEETLLPSGTYNLQIFLHQALNRSAYHVASHSHSTESIGRISWGRPLADVFGAEDSLDSVADLRWVYRHLPAPLVAGKHQLQWRWPGGTTFQAGGLGGSAILGLKTGFGLEAFFFCWLKPLDFLWIVFFLKCSGSREWMYICIYVYIYIYLCRLDVMK